MDMQKQHSEFYQNLPEYKALRDYADIAGATLRVGSEHASGVMRWFVELSFEGGLVGFEVSDSRLLPAFRRVALLLAGARGR